MTRYLTSEDAMRALKIRRQTLYAYVSRGLIRAEGDDADSRRSLYRVEDVEALLTRKRRGRTPARGAQTALDWGLPVLDSAITLVERGRLYYRGQDAVALAEGGASLEDAARLMWVVGDGLDPFAAVPAPAGPSNFSGPPLSRCLDLLARRIATEAPALPADQDRKQCAAAGLVRAVAAALGQYEPDTRPIHEGLARSWGVDDRAEIIRMALVLCADHELNASTFTARCVASTGATLDAAVAGGLAALSGPLHGGAAARVAALFRDAERTGDGARAVSDWLGRGEPYLPGFGHALYPDGDPRGQALLARLGRPTSLADAVAVIGGAVAQSPLRAGRAAAAVRVARGRAVRAVRGGQDCGVAGACHGAAGEG